MNALYNVVLAMAEKQAVKKTVKIYHLLYGYAKVVMLNNSVIRTMTEMSEEECEQKKNELIRIFEEKNIDYGLIQEGMPILFLVEGSLKANVDMEKYLHPENPEEPELAKELLELILKEDIPELEYFHKGSDLDAIFKFMEERNGIKKVSRKEPEEERKEEQRQTPPLSQILGQSTGESTPSKPQKQKKTKTEEEPADGFAGLIQLTQNLYDEIAENVKGQDDAIRKLVRGYFESVVVRSQEKDNKRPQATFLFAGPPGVGKTYMAEMIAKPLGYTYKRFDMSEYSSHHSTNEFAGSDPVYKNPSKGRVTSFVDENPKSVILFDEIEKADRSIIYLFLQILEGGSLTDNYMQKKVSFKDTILIFTTNVGRELYQDSKHKNLTALPNDVILEALQVEKKRDGETGAMIQAFPPEICSRFATGNIIMFNHLPIHHLASIVRKKFDSCVEMVKQEHGIEIELDEKLPFVFLYNQSGGADGRIASSKSIGMIKQEIYELGRTLQNAGADNLKSIKKILFVVGECEENEEVSYLFVNKECSNILVISDKQINDDVLPAKNFKLTYAKDAEEMFALLKKDSFEMVLIDVMYGMQEQEISYLSQGDIQSEGVSCLTKIRDKMPAMPVMIIENPDMNKEDRNSFLQMGVRNILPIDEEGNIRAKELYRRIEENYFQKCAKELADRGKVLEFNTAQYVSEDKESAVIRYYGFHTRVTAFGDQEKKMVTYESKPKDRFADVIGAENAKGELQYFIKYLKNPKTFMADGLERPKGVLLYGPPGTGKTMLARAMAGESDVTFLPATASGLIGSYMGEGEKKIRELFATARRFAPAIIFIDEIDAIAKERTGESKTESMLNTLLTEMDGFEVDPERPVFVLAATNFGLEKGAEGKRSALDPALIRRFANRIYVDLPNEDERYRYLQMMLNKKKRIQDVSEKVLQNIAQRTTGQSLAIIQNIIDLAIRNAVKEEKPFNDAYLLNALEEYQYGEEFKLDEAYYRSVAIHESGHAYINWLSGEVPSYVTIVSRGDFLGYMQHANAEKNPNYTKDDLLAKIRTSLAGRAAEIVNFGEKEGTNTGIASDLQNATNVAMRMISRYGMMENQLVSIDAQYLLNSSMADKFLAQVNQLLNEQMQETLRLVQDGNEKIKKMAEILLKKNQIVGAEIEAIFKED